MCKPSTNNLFSNISGDLPNELVATLLDTDNLRIERIVSRGHASPEGFWYDQQEHEWVIVLQGSAMLQFEGDHEPIRMKPGDFINIPAHKRHRVDWTTPAEPTVWLAIYYA
jgi:cupin 2 domain-containing protein